MTEKAARKESAPPTATFGLRELWRLALWGIAAGGALALAVYVSTTPIGHRRVVLAAAELQEAIFPTGITPPRPLDARDGQRLAEAVQLLTVDRGRLLARLTTLERSLDDVTASVTRVEKTAQPTPPPQQPDPGAAVPATPPPATISPPAAEDITSSVTPVPEGAQPAAAAKAEFGLDLGGASTLEALRAAWAAAKRRHGSLLEGLHPLVHMRERPRPAAAELRLVVGPIPNAATAARMCATLAAARAVCQPVPFDGQQLAVR